MTQDEDFGTVLVTGAGRRLGRSISLDFATRGWRVGIHYGASAADALALVEDIERKGGKAAAFAADLGRLDTLAPLIAACAKALGPPICLINNAARFGWDTLKTLDGASWQAHLDVNLRAPIFLTQAFAEALPDQSSGNVINLIDQKVLRPDPQYFSYTIAKAALWTATQTMAQALAPRIRVNAIAPGPVLKSEGQSQAEFERECQATPLHRGVGADDITAAIRFLLETNSVTGQMIALDAGQHLAWRGKTGAG
jgi:NAD(P)-dependent dehydrogenase (short-subunit alcohol dehydrogenase family)